MCIIQDLVPYYVTLQHAFDALVVAREYCRTEIAEMLLEHARAQEESVLDKSLHAMQHAVGQGQ